MLRKQVEKTVHFSSNRLLRFFFVCLQCKKIPFPSAFIILDVHKARSKFSGNCMF